MTFLPAPHVVRFEVPISTEQRIHNLETVVKNQQDLIDLQSIQINRLIKMALENGNLLIETREDVELLLGKRTKVIK